MKKVILGALFTSVMLASCSNDELLVNGSDNQGDNGEGRYITFNIVSSGMGSRAGEDGTTQTPTANGVTEGGFESGEGDENTIKNAVFCFFDANGNPTQTPVLKNISFKDSVEGDPAVEKISDVTVVIAGPVEPKYAVVILNATDSTYYGHLKDKNLNYVTTQMSGQYGVADQGGKFVMSNSVYFDHENPDQNFNGNGKFNWDGAKLVNATDISKYTFKTPEEAKDSVCTVYVERVTAKVTTTAIGKDFSKDETLTLSDGTKITYRTVIKGMEIANIPQRANLIKNMDGWETWKDQWPGLNDYTNRRSYWANTANNVQMYNQSWTKVSDSTAKDYATPSKEQKFYILPNTIPDKNAQSIVLTAQIVKVEDGQEKEIDLLRWGGNYYLKEGFLDQLASQLKAANYVIYDNREGASTKVIDFKDKDLTWMTDKEHKDAVAAGDLESYEMAAKLNVSLKDGQSFCKRDKDASGKPTYTKVTENVINQELCKKENRVWIWEKGMCYYFVNIGHFGPSVPFTKGTVRNHVYQLTLNSLTGLGTPVYNPDELIIPEKPKDELFYLAAQIKVLKWKIVSQTVDFGK